MLPDSYKQKALQELLDVLYHFDSVDTCKRFLMDLCTPQELQALSDRWQVAKLIHQQVPYRKISEITGASTATISRVAKSLLHGENGYQSILNTASNTMEKNKS